MVLFSRTCLALALTSSISLSAFSADNNTNNTDILDTAPSSFEASVAPQANTNHLVTSEASERAKTTLIAKLATIEFFSGDFTQQVFDTDHKLIQQGAGTMVVKKPNKVHWQTVTPEESLIVSDGETLWLYDPFIEQASAFSLENAVVNTPILLLTNESKDVWLDYHISEPVKNTFKVVAKNTQSQSQIESLFIEFSDVNLSDINTITINDITGQRSEISLKNTNYTTQPKAELFNFVVPEGVFIDDQR